MKSRISYLNSFVLPTKIAAASIAIFVLTSCGGGNGKPLSEAKADPAGAYREYLFEIRKQDNLSVEDLTEHLKHWQTVRESVLTLKEQLSSYTEDKELHHAAEECRPFFASLDNRPACRGTKQQILYTYRALLAETIRIGIHNHEDLTTFIEKEDAVFRAFLTHLHNLDGENTADITRDTERCCSQAFLAAERKEITYQEAMIYLAMRTNRRLIQNVQTCIDDIRYKQVKTPAQAHTYIWMLLQPYASLDGFCMALLSPDDRKHLNRIAAQTPAAFEALSKILQSKDSRLDELPGMLIEIFIHTL